MPMLTTVSIRFPRDSLPLPRADLVGELIHAVQHLVHVLHHVLAVDDELCVAGETQCGVQYRAVLGDVDPLTVEHGIAAAGQIHLLRQTHEGAHDIVVDQVLGEVDPQISEVEGELFSSVRVSGEPAAQIWDESVLEGAKVCPSLGGGGVYRCVHGPSLERFTDRHAGSCWVACG